MLPTPSWLRFRKSRERQQQQSVAAAAAAAEDASRQQLATTARDKELESRVAGPESAANLNVNRTPRSKLDWRAGSKQTKTSQAQAQAIEEDQNNERELQQQQPSHERDQAQGPVAAARSSRRRLPFTRKTLVGLIQRALSPISAGTSGGRRSQAEAQRAAATAAEPPERAALTYEPAGLDKHRQHHHHNEHHQQRQPPQRPAQHHHQDHRPDDRTVSRLVISPASTWRRH